MPVELADGDVPAPPQEVVRVRPLDPALAAALDRDGYVRLGPLLDEGEIARADEVFAEAARQLADPIGDRWFPTILLPDDAVRSQITRGLSELIVPKLPGLLTPVEVVRLDYSVKPSSEASGLGPHQDFSLVDEQTAQSLYLWVPLCDTEAGNGTLHVVPGSHRFTNRVRSRHVPSVFDEVLDEVRAASVRLDCAAGEAILMVSGVIHWSPPNESGRLRLAAHGILTPPEVPLVFYFQDERTPPDQVECYELEIDAYVSSIHHGRPADVAPDRCERRPVSSMSPERFARGMAAYRSTGPPQ